MTKTETSIPTTILSFDPGYSTGFARAEVVGNTFHLRSAEVIAWPDRFAIVGIFRNAVAALRAAKVAKLLIVVESFHLYKHKAQDLVGSDMPSAQVIGIIETSAFLNGFHNGQHPMIVYQPASCIARVNVDGYLLNGKPLKSPHTRDALAHAKYYWATKLFKVTPATSTWLDESKSLDLDSDDLDVGIAKLMTGK